MLAIVILLITVIVFTVYFKQHPNIFASLKSVPMYVIAVLFMLYVAFIGTLAWIQQATLKLCNVRLGNKESALLMSYSAIVNFFGPLQSGPAFRAAYLKSKHNVNLKRYGVATLLYYGLYAAFSGLLLLVFIAGWWVLPVIVAALALAPLLKRVTKFQTLDLAAVRNLALATLAQSAVQSLIYYIELHSLSAHVTYLQALIYTGAANFALFVSVTPGAIGFRESFLLLAQRLHHISSGVVATASLLDRAVYVSLLVVMALFIFGFHAQRFLHVNTSGRETDKA